MKTNNAIAANSIGIRKRNHHHNIRWLSVVMMLFLLPYITISFRFTHSWILFCRHHHYHYHHHHARQFSFSLSSSINPITTTNRPVASDDHDSDDRIIIIDDYDNDNVDNDDQQLLRMITKKQLTTLCRQCNVTIEHGMTKSVLLQQLRRYGREMMARNRQYEKQRIDRIESSWQSSSSKERYEIIDDDDDRTNHHDDIDHDDTDVLFFDESLLSKAFRVDDDHDDNNNSNLHQKVSNQTTITTTTTTTSATATTETTTTSHHHTAVHVDDGTDTIQTRSTGKNRHNDSKRRRRRQPTAHNDDKAKISPPQQQQQQKKEEEEKKEVAERVETIYSTTEVNDLTGMTFGRDHSNELWNSHHNSYHDHDDETSSSSSSFSLLQPNHHQYNENDVKRRKEKAIEQMTEFMQILLSMTGLPSFTLHSLLDHDDDDDDDDDDHVDADDDDDDGLAANRRMFRHMQLQLRQQQQQQPLSSTGTFIGFQPEKVPIDLLLSVSPILLACHGNDDSNIFYDIMKYYEIQAIGYDGKHGDDVMNGGGHYYQIQKIRTFLEGYQLTQQKKQARKTIVMLLEQIIMTDDNDRYDHFDMLLSSLPRGYRNNYDILLYHIQNHIRDVGGDGTDYPILNDMVLHVLNDMIRQQEQKVLLQLNRRRQQQQQQQQQQEKMTSNNIMTHNENDNDPINELWNITVDDDGQHIESIDPNDPTVQRLVREEIMMTMKDQQQQQQQNEILDEKSSTRSTNEVISYLLQLIRERIKVELTYFPKTMNDKKLMNHHHYGGDNDHDDNTIRSYHLRLLAYCIHTKSNIQRKQLIRKYIGHSIDRLDSFIDLIISSIEYSQCVNTNNELQPGGPSGNQLTTTKKLLLDVNLLQTILDDTKQIRIQSQQQRQQQITLKP